MGKKDGYDRLRKARKEWYTLDRILGCGNWAEWFVLLGGRGHGKSYSVMEWFLKQWKKKRIRFKWLVLSETSSKMLLSANAQNFIDPDLRRKYKLEITSKGTRIYDHDRYMCDIVDLSTFAKNKVGSWFDSESTMPVYMCLDEMNREKAERKTFSIVYNFKNTIEQNIRHFKGKFICFLIGNILEEGSDILGMFNFFPEKPGVYKLKRKKAVVELLDPTEAMQKRRKTSKMASLGQDESTFTGMINHDRRYIWEKNKRPTRPSYVADFGDGIKFTLWDGHLIKPYNKEMCVSYGILRHTNSKFSKEVADALLMLYDQKLLHYTDLSTMYNFRLCMKQVRNK